MPSQDFSRCTWSLSVPGEDTEVPVSGLAWGTLLITGFHLSVKPLTVTLWMQASSQFLTHLTVNPSDLYLSSSEIRTLLGELCFISVQETSHASTVACIPMQSLYRAFVPSLNTEDNNSSVRCWILYACSVNVPVGYDLELWFKQFFSQDT